MLVDSHCHLNYPEFEDIQATLAAADELGVKVMQTISTKREDFPRVIKIAESDERIWASIGVHPHEAEDHQDLTVDELLTLVKHPRVIGVGETGLDYFYEHSPREAQQACFRTHIEASRQTGLPIIVHTRDADDDTMAILREEHAKGAFPILIHCFSTSHAMAECAIELGGYVSISGIVTFKKAVELHESVRKLPLDRLLVETDSPYLAPIPHRGKKNQPAYTRHVAEKVAELKGISLEEVAEATTNNFYTLFNKAKR
jgi:TatD DNase family protein